MNSKINKLYENIYRFGYSDKESTFEELFKYFKPMSIHQGNLQVLVCRNIQSPLLYRKLYV